MQKSVGYLLFAATLAGLFAFAAAQASCLRGTFTCQTCNGQNPLFPVYSGTETWTASTFNANYNLASSAQCSNIVFSGPYTTSAITSTSFNVSASGTTTCNGSGSVTSGCSLVCGGFQAQASNLDTLNFSNGCASYPTTYTDRYGNQWRGASVAVQASAVLIAALGVLLAFA